MLSEIQRKIMITFTDAISRDEFLLDGSSREMGILKIRKTESIGNEHKVAIGILRD